MQQNAPQPDRPGVQRSKPARPAPSTAAAAKLSRMDHLERGCDVQITKWIQSPHDKKVTLFVCQIIPKQNRPEVWEVKRRYREFQAVHKALKSPDLSLPAKKVFGNTGPKHLEARRAKLQVFLSNLVSIPALFKQQQSLHFLQAL